MNMLSALRGAWSLLLVIPGLLSLAACGDGGAYRKRSGQWMFDDRPVEPADVRSFKPIDDRFAHDAVQGYYRGEAIVGSEGASFEALSRKEARDAKQVYWAGTYRNASEFFLVKRSKVSVVEGADPASYQVLKYDYARDAKRAYYEGRGFAVRDVASFTPIDYRFARDAQRGYFERVEIPGSDGASFELVAVSEGGYARDRNRVYHAYVELNDPNERMKPVVRVVAGADPATIRVLGSSYATDGNKVWWRGVPVQGADAASFAVTVDGPEGIDAKDAKGAFREGRRVDPSALDARVSLATRPQPK